MQPDQTWLETAATITHGERNGAYGHPLRNFLGIALKWSVTLACPVTLRQVVWMMVDLKSVRDENAMKDDNYVDGMGYLATAERMDFRLKEMGFENGLVYTDIQPGESDWQFMGRMFNLWLEAREWDVRNGA